jgi:hypothetical protein
MVNSDFSFESIRKTMRMKKHLSAKSRVILVVLLGLATSLSATVTHAGFQWVPPTSKDVAKTNDSIPPAEPVPTGEVDATVLPMPSEQAVVPAQPQLNAADTAPQTLQLPPSYQQPLAPPPSVVTEAQHQENVLKVKTISPAQPLSAPPAPTQAAAPVPPPVQEPVPLMAEPIAAPAPVAQQPLSAPPAFTPAPEPVSAPVVTQAKVIMPQDAPQTAVDNTPNSEKLVINPYPTNDAQPVPAPAPLAAPAQPVSIVQPLAPVPAPQGNFEIVEGFGSDMPLALALQQIVPAGYATSFGSGVNPGAAVTWDGGKPWKPWNQIISDMLAPHNLEVQIDGKVVNIRQPGAQQHSAAPTQEELLRRPNIKDPGEQSQIQAADSLAGIESASGTPTEIAPNASAEAPAAALDAAIEEAAQLPLPEQVDAEATKESPGPQAAAEQTGTWEAKAGESLKDTLTRWSEKAGVEMIWMASYDSNVKQDISLEDNFASAVQTITTDSDVQATKNEAPGVNNIVIKDRS